MRIGIIGIINHDTIEMANGRVLYDLGGILYNTIVLADVVDKESVLYPISRIGADCYENLAETLASRTNVSIDGINLSPKGTSRNHIRYDASMEKIGRLTNHIGSIPLTQVEPYVDCDALLVNFIVGDDINLETMKEIRKRSSGLLYLDVHNLCLAIDAEGYRHRRAPANWREWIGLFDIAQMNEVEAQLLAGGNLEHTEDFIAFGETVIVMGPSTFISTRGSLGSVTVYQQNGKTNSIVTSPETAPDLVDTTGCGDAFAAGFLVSYLSTKDPAQATQLATRVATLNCAVAGMPGVGWFREQV